MLINARTFEIIPSIIEMAQRDVKRNMPQSHFYFLGCDAKYIYFRVAANTATAEQISNIKAKTEFEATEESLPDETGSPYMGDFKVVISPRFE
jgi:hypothetical protein